MLVVASLVVLSLLCLYGVLSYSSASVGNNVSLTITDPENSLISIDIPELIAVTKSDANGLTTADLQDAGSSQLIVTNNMGVGISYHLEFAPGTPDGFSFAPASGYLWPGGAAGISLAASSSCSPGDYLLTAYINAWFEDSSGNARIKTELNVTVAEPEQDTFRETETLQATSANPGKEKSDEKTDEEKTDEGVTGDTEGADGPGGDGTGDNEGGSNEDGAGTGESSDDVTPNEDAVNEEATDEDIPGENNIDNSGTGDNVSGTGSADSADDAIGASDGTPAE